MFPLESPHQGDSNECKQHAIINIKKKITINYPICNNVCSYGIFCLGIQVGVRKSRGKRAIGVRAIEVLLYLCGQALVSSRVAPNKEGDDNNNSVHRLPYLFGYKIGFSPL